MAHSGSRTVDGVAYWFRPHALGWLIADGIFLVMNRERMKGPAILALGFVGFLTVIALQTRRVFPDYNFGATTASVNLMMSADSSATGTYNGKPFVKGEPPIYRIIGTPPSGAAW